MGSEAGRPPVKAPFKPDDSTGHQCTDKRDDDLQGVGIHNVWFSILLVMIRSSHDIVTMPNARPRKRVQFLQFRSYHIRSIYGDDRVD